MHVFLASAGFRKVDYHSEQCRKGHHYLRRGPQGDVHVCVSDDNNLSIEVERRQQMVFYCRGEHKDLEKLTRWVRDLGY